MTTPGLVEHFFRHEYGKLVASLSRRVGVHNLEAVEDAVQSALMTALESWRVAGLPDNPSAWLFRVAHNNLMGDLRQRSGRRRLLEQSEEADITASENDPGVVLAGEVRDDLLRMLFVCCDEAIPVESQLVFALKTLCGFGVREIALRLFTSEANVYKRLGRARSRLREAPPRPVLGAVCCAADLEMCPLGQAPEALRRSVRPPPRAQAARRRRARRLGLYRDSGGRLLPRSTRR